MKNAVSLTQQRPYQLDNLSPREERIMRCRAQRFQNRHSGICGTNSEDIAPDSQLEVAMKYMQEMTTQLVEQFTQMISSVVDRLINAVTGKKEGDHVGGCEKPKEETPIETAPTEQTSDTPSTENVASTTTPDETITNDTSTSFDAKVFESDIRELLNNGGKNGKVNEERFQFAIAAHLIKNKDEHAYESFVTSFRKANKKGANGVEDATKNALKELVQNGQLTKKEAREINGVSFAAAQLDDNDKALYDGRGGKNDPTVAKMKIDKAITKATSVLEQYYAGELSIAPRKLNSPSTPVSSSSDAAQATSTAGSGEFLWKPVSESDGKLVVLLPSELRGNIDTVSIYASLPADNSSLIEEGNFTGDDHNGNRPHFRFSQAGGG
ncbi:MAG: hypothetical protein KDD55_11525, partial [Bdellovibrionales bacterium]|nr:hypothetical protein [Bdellovibrionales bacterium]